MKGPFHLTCVVLVVRNIIDPNLKTHISDLCRMSTPCVDESPIVVLAIKDFQFMVGGSRDHASTIEVEVNGRHYIFMSGIRLLYLIRLTLCR